MTGTYRHTVSDNRRKAASRAKECARLINLMRDGDSPYAQEIRALKKARDALNNDPFFKDKKNKGLAEILHWLIDKKRRCEQQAFYSVDPRDPQIAEKIIVEKIKKGNYV